MKITRDQLKASDFDILFTRDPGLFIESIIINLNWAKHEESEAQAIARIRYIFLRWLDLYANNATEEYAKEQSTAYTDILAKLETAAEQRGFMKGRIHALANLPIRKGVLTNYVDLDLVAKELRKLKAFAPEGVTNERH
jgi:hypothetical protein